MRQKTILLERCDTGRIQIKNQYKGYDIRFWCPNKDAILLSALLKTLKEGDRIELKIIKMEK